MSTASEEVAKLRREIATNWALCEKAQRAKKQQDEAFYRGLAVQGEDRLFRRYGERTVGADDGEETL